MNTAHFKELIIRSLSGEISDQEKLQLSEWLNADVKNQKLKREITDAWNNAELYHADLNADNVKAWNNVEKSIEKPKTSLQLKWFMVAASLVFLLSASWFFLKPSWSNDHPAFVEYHNQTEDILRYNLSDGSSVALKPGSQLRFEDKDIRTVTLNGEAYFDVQQLKDRPFQVYTGKTRITVLGTQFYVNQNNSEIKVSLIEGSIAFEAHDEKLILKPNEWATYNSQNETLAHKGTFNKNQVAWLKEDLVFNQSPLENVLRSVNAYFQSNISLQGKYQTCTFTGNLKNQNIEQIIEVLSYTFDIDHRTEGETVILFVRKCTN